MTGLVAGGHAGQESGWQPVHRPPTGGHDPGELDRDVHLVLAFLNTLDAEEGTDQLLDEADWHAWVRGAGLTVAGDRGRARIVRDVLRDSITDRGHPIIDPSASAPVRVELTGGMPVLVGGDALGAVLAAGARLVVLGQWDRLKICAAGECRWAFFDRSRNRSRTWCSMRVCGNRTKARNWRQRTRAGSPVAAAAAG